MLPQEYAGVFAGEVSRDFPRVRGRKGWRGIRDAAASLPRVPGGRKVCPSREGLTLGGGGSYPSLFFTSGVMSMLLEG